MYAFNSLWNSKARAGAAAGLLRTWRAAPMWKGKDGEEEEEEEEAEEEATYLSDQGRAAGFWMDGTRGLPSNPLFQWKGLFFKLHIFGN